MITFTFKELSTDIIGVTIHYFRPCHSSGGKSPASHRGGLGSMHRSRSICGGKSGTGACFLQVLRGFLLILIPPMLHTHLSSGAGTIGLIVACVPSELNHTTLQLLKCIIFWDMESCSPFSFNRRFGGTYRLHLQGRRNRFRKPASKQVASRIPEDYILFITTAVKTSNPTSTTFIRTIFSPTNV
jgi:hypothetical protein